MNKLYQGCQSPVHAVTYLKIGKEGGHIKGVFETEVLQLGPEAELLWGVWGIAQKLSNFWNLN